MPAPNEPDTHDATSPPPLIDYEDDHADGPTKGAFRIGGLAVAISALLCVVFIIFVVTRPGGL